MTTETQHNILERIAACVPVLVDEGCPEHGIDVLYLPTGISAIQRLIIAGLKEWFTETVVPWAIKTHSLHSEIYWRKGVWAWSSWYSGESSHASGSNPDPTEAFVQCLEALCEVVKQSKIEGGE